MKIESEMPLVSIIVPVYNVQNYIRKCINSICNQTYGNLEIILIDDGSTDLSGVICDEYQKIDSRIIVIHKENAGQGTARNKGLQCATGELIAFLDSDDSMELTCIEYLYQNMLNNDLDISSCNYGRYDENENFLSLFENKYADFIVSGIEAQKRIWYAECINLAPWGKLYKKELWKGIKFETCWFEDYATMYKVYIQAKKFGYLHEPQVKYLVRNNSAVRGFDKSKLKTLDVADETIIFCEKKYPELLNAARKKAVNMYFHNYMQIPLKQPEYKEVLTRIKLFIKKNRWSVLSDKRADKKVKIALLLSLFSYKLAWFVFRQKKRKNILF